MIECLRNLDVVLIGCEIDGDLIHFKMMQIDRAKLPFIKGTLQALRIPKQPDTPLYCVRIPHNVTELFYDDRLPLESITEACAS